MHRRFPRRNATVRQWLHGHAQDIQKKRGFLAYRLHYSSIAYALPPFPLGYENLERSVDIEDESATNINGGYFWRTR